MENHQNLITIIFLKIQYAITIKRIIKKKLLLNGISGNDLPVNNIFKFDNKKYPPAGTIIIKSKL